MGGEGRIPEQVKPWRLVRELMSVLSIRAPGYLEFKMGMQFLRATCGILAFLTEEPGAMAPKSPEASGEHSRACPLTC